MSISVAKTLCCEAIEYDALRENTKQTRTVTPVENTLSQYAKALFSQFKNQQVRSLNENQSFMRACQQKADRLRKAYLIDSALTQVNDCWGVPNVSVCNRSIHVLFKRTKNGIGVSFPEDLQAAKVGFRDMERCLLRPIKEPKQVEKLSRSRSNRSTLNPYQTAANFFQHAYRLEYVLTQINDCWEVPNIYVRSKLIHILFQRSAEGIKVSFPKDLQEAKRGLRDMKYRVRVRGEYPKALGEYLCPKQEIDQLKASMHPNETMILVHHTFVEAYPILYVLQINDKEGNHSIRYFGTKAACERTLAWFQKMRHE